MNHCLVASRSQVRRPSLRLLVPDRDRVRAAKLGQDVPARAPVAAGERLGSGRRPVVGVDGVRGAVETALVNAVDAVGLARGGGRTAGERERTDRHRLRVGEPGRDPPHDLELGSRSSREVEGAAEHQTAVVMPARLRSPCDPPLGLPARSEEAQRVHVP